MSHNKFNQDDFNGEFLEMMAGYAEALEVPLSEMMQRMLIRRFAEDRASIDVYDVGGPDMVLEFMEFDGLEPRELFRILYNMKRHKLEQEYIEQLRQVPPDAWRPEEKELMKRYKMDPESKKQKEQEDNFIQSLIDSGDLIVDEKHTGKKTIYEP